jgi:pimeloyl-ACP methyl ester carboxylesterase
MMNGKVQGALFLAAVSGLFVTGSCVAPPPPTPEQADAGLVFMVPGIKGNPWLLYWAAEAFRDAGIERELRIYDWAAFPALCNLVDYAGNCRHAEVIAAELVEYHQLHPDAPIDVVGYSGGGGLAVMAVERLPDSLRVRRLVLVQPAISPDYDLTLTMSRVEGDVVNLYSCGDWFVLGLGTRLFGTMDRRYVISAGKKGFDAERAAPHAGDRRRLVQVPWKPEMVRTLHLGGHNGIILYEWNRACVAPYVLLPEERRERRTQRNGARPASVVMFE